MTIWEVVVGPTGDGVAGPPVAPVGAGALGPEVAVVGGVVGGGDVATLDSGVPLPVVGGPGGDVARGEGQVGSRYSASNWRNCDSAWSRLPPGSPV